MKAHTAQRIITALALTISIMSILYPFLETRWVGLRIPEAILGPEDFWSYRHTEAYGTSDRLTLTHVDWWFIDFWSEARYNISFEKEYFHYVGPLVLVTIFLTQILTVMFGTLSTVKPIRPLLLLSTILSSATVFYMTLIIQALSNEYEKFIQTGYGLAVASTVLFLTAFIWKITRRQQPTLRHLTYVAPPKGHNGHS